MKKSLIIMMAVLTMFTFGVASSSHAFVGLTTLTVVCVSAFAAIVGADKVIDKDNAKQGREDVKAESQEVRKVQELSAVTTGG